MRRALSILSLLAVTGCAAGPDFSAPPAPDIAAYDATPTAGRTSDQTQILVKDRDIPAEWWALFYSAKLNGMIEQGLKDNPDLASADAALRQAEDNLSAGSADLFPSVKGSFSSQREQTASASSGGYAPRSIYTLHNASVSVSYGVDLFGGTRRAIEGLQAQADYARFEKEAAYLSLTSNIVTTAIAEASLRGQIDATTAIIARDEEILRIVQAQFAAGAVAKSTLMSQQSVLATARTALPPLQHQLAVTRHSLSALLGQLPTQEPAAQFTLADLQLPKEVPLSVPSKLVGQRPDIRAAAENLHAASAAIGVAEAARLPDITLSADIGSMANIFSKLFTPGGGFWSFGGSAAETLFDAGALASKEDSARDAYDVAAAQYRKAVLTGFQDVADALHALQSDADSLTAQREAEAATAEALALAQAQFSAGATAKSELLAAEQAEQQSKVALIKAQAQRYADTAALLAALGGGWWNRGQDRAASGIAPPPQSSIIVGDKVIISPDIVKGTP